MLPFVSAIGFVLIAVGVLGMIVYALLPYMSQSTNPTVRTFVFILGVLGFGNGLRAAPDQTAALTADQLDDKAENKQLIAGDFVTHTDGDTVKREPGA